VQNIFGFIIYPLELGLALFAVVLGSAGIGIILFTILVRAVLSPLQIVQLRNAKAMQRLQPHIAELRKKHKDRAELQQKTMELYREHQVNPAMGCLPTLLQFPILIGLFYALRDLGNSIPKTVNEVCNGFHVHTASQWLDHCYRIKGAAGSTTQLYNLFHAHFLWLSNGLGQPDPTYILPILAGVTQWIQSRMMLTRSTDPQQQTMNTMMNFMPLMIVFFATKYASGLSLYWVTSTLIGIVIQYRITGLGLLADTFGGLYERFGPQRESGNRPTGRTPAAPRPSQPSGSKGGAPKAAPADDTKQDTAEMNGKSEADGDAEIVAATVQRKRANRARGGRRSGRRG